MQTRGGKLSDRLAALETELAKRGKRQRSKAERDALCAAALSDPLSSVADDLARLEAGGPVSGATMEQGRAAIAAAWRANS